MKIKIAIAAYSISAIVAFGHSAHNSKHEDEFVALWGGVFAAAFNPLYWSWVAQERNK